MTLKSLHEELVLLERRVDLLEKRKGPKSTREMTRKDAEMVIHGELKKLSHKAAAEKLGLSYGQVYSARSGYTFKDLTDPDS
jgi:hypothetical protein